MKIQRNNESTVSPSPHKLSQIQSKRGEGEGEREGPTKVESLCDRIGAFQGDGDGVHGGRRAPPPLPIRRRRRPRRRLQPPLQGRGSRPPLRQQGRSVPQPQVRSVVRAVRCSWIRLAGCCFLLDPMRGCVVGCWIRAFGLRRWVARWLCEFGWPND